MSGGPPGAERGGVGSFVLRWHRSLLSALGEASLQGPLKSDNHLLGETKTGRFTGENIRGNSADFHWAAPILT